MKVKKVVLSVAWYRKKLRNVVSLHILHASKQEGEERKKKENILFFGNKEVSDLEFILPFP